MLREQRDEEYYFDPRKSMLSVISIPPILSRSTDSSLISSEPALVSPTEKQRTA